MAKSLKTVSAASLVIKSAYTGETVRAAYTDELAEELLLVCDDHVAATHVAAEWEFWGVIDDGPTWRVHLTPAG